MNRSDIVTTLELVSGALSNQNLVPMFQCFCFDGTHVTAHNDTIGIVGPCKTDGAYAINGATLLGLLQNSHAGDVEFVVEDTHDISIRTGRSRFKLPYIPAEEFLFKEPNTDDFKTKLPINSGLLKGLEACLMTSSKDVATQAALAGVTLTKYGDCTALYSSDGDAITRYVTTIPKSKDEACLLPNDFCSAVQKIYAETEAKSGTIQISPEWARALVNTGYSIYGRLTEITTPLDYEQEIVNTIKGKISYLPVPKGLNAALTRARIIADPESAKTTLTVENEKLKLYTETHMGIVRDVMTYGKSQPVTAEVSAELVQRALSLCNEMSIIDGCTAYREGKELFIVLGNMG